MFLEGKEEQRKYFRLEETQEVMMAEGNAVFDLRFFCQKKRLLNQLPEMNGV
jgi:hypothetical protein